MSALRLVGLTAVVSVALTVAGLSLHACSPAQAAPFPRVDEFAKGAIGRKANGASINGRSLELTGLTLTGPATSSSYFRSTAASGQPAFVMDNTGARICFNGPTCTAFWASGPGSVVTGNMLPSFGRYEASSTSLAYQANSVTAGNNAFSVGINGARFDTGTGTNDYLASDGTAVTTAGYGVGPGTAGQFAGAPTAGDCDADAERGRLALDTTSHRLYVCNGLTRGWDYVALTD